MRWLFLFMLFDVSAGQIQPRLRLHVSFQSERECNELGSRIEREYRYEDNSLRSFSICIPESALNDTEIQTERLDQ